jgi:hypothetical protein
MDTNRIIFTDIDQSQFNVAETDIKAFFVARAPRGNKTADLFPGGSFDMFVQRLGIPTKDYPGLKEAYDYIVKSGRSAWVSAPAGITGGSSNYVGGCYLTSVASVYPFYKVNDSENPNFYLQFTADSDSAAKTAGFDKGITVLAADSPNTIVIDKIPDDFYAAMVAETPSTDTLTPFTLVFNTDVSTTHTVTGFEASGLNWEATDGGDTILGTVATGSVAGTKKITFTGMTALYVVDSEHVSWSPTIDATDWIIGSIYQSSPREDATVLTFTNFDLTALISDETNPLYDTFKLAYSEAIPNYQTVSKTAFSLSPVPSKKDGQGSLIDMNSALSNNNLLRSISYLDTLVPLTGYTWAASTSISISGTRLIEAQTLEADLTASLAEGWVEAASTDYATAVLYVEPECYEGLADDIAALRAGGGNELANYITGVKFATSTTPTGGPAGEISTKRALYAYNRGVSYSVNEFYMSDYLGKYYWHIPVGHVAVMLANIIENRLGGAAPMWLNESGLGGQLTTFSAKKQKYSLTADDLDNFDEYGFNPIIKDSLYGYMLTSQKTAQAPTLLTDWSFLGHQMAFDSLKREIKTNVMIPQLGKSISDYYLDLRERQTQAIVNKRLNAGIWADAIAEVKSVNTDDTKAENKFVIKVRVKVYPYSEYVELILNNVGQNVEV